MKQFRIIIILLFTFVVVIFSIQNSEVVEVNFLAWTIEISRALLMLACAAIGSISTILALIPTLFGKKKKSDPPEQIEDKENS